MYWKLQNANKKGVNKWRDISYTCIERLHTVKMSTFPKLIYRFNAISIKIFARFLVDIDKHSKIYKWKGKWTRRAKTTLEKIKVRGITLLGFKTYCTATVIKNVCPDWCGWVGRASSSKQKVASLILVRAHAWVPSQVPLGWGHVRGNQPAFL